MSTGLLESLTLCWLSKRNGTGLGLSHSTDPAIELSKIATLSLPRLRLWLLLAVLFDQRKPSRSTLDCLRLRLSHPLIDTDKTEGLSFHTPVPSIQVSEAGKSSLNE